MKVDFHIHTNLSEHRWLWKYGLMDGLHGPAEMAKYAKKRGLDAICITDHNHIFGNIKAKKLSKEIGILIVSGAEMDIEINGKTKEYIMIGCDKKPVGDNLTEIVEFIHDNNGLVIAPHPNDIFGRGIKNFNKFDGIEVINGFGTKCNYNGNSNKALVTGSDAHYYRMLGYSYTIIEADNIDELFEKIEKTKTKPMGKSFPKHLLFPYYLKKWNLWRRNLTDRLRK